jgi:excinuclease UvrABC nuclease subunit
MYEEAISKYIGMMTKLQAEPTHNLDTASENIPEESGVYVICNSKEKRVTYVRRTKNLRRRLLKRALSKHAKKRILFLYIARTLQVENLIATS